MKNSIGLNKERKAAEKIETASLYDLTIYCAPHFKIDLMKLFLMVFVILSLTACYGKRAAHKHHYKGGHGINSYEHFDKPGKY